MKERIYLKKDLEETMDKLDEMYKQQTTLNNDLKLHRSMNDKLQEKLKASEIRLRWL